MLINAPNYIFYPITILWSLVYGMIGGAFFKVLAVYENWKAINLYHVKLWKKFPQRSYQKYISSIWSVQIRGKPLEYAEFAKIQIEKNHPNEPFPFFTLLFNTVSMIIVVPLAIIIGMFMGPLYVYRKSTKQRLLYLNNHNYSDTGSLRH